MRKGGKKKGKKGRKGNIAALGPEDEKNMLASKTESLQAKLCKKWFFWLA